MGNLKSRESIIFMVQYQNKTRMPREVRQINVFNVVHIMPGPDPCLVVKLPVPDMRRFSTHRIPVSASVGRVFKQRVSAFRRPSIHSRMSRLRSANLEGGTQLGGWRDVGERASSGGLKDFVERERHAEFSAVKLSDHRQFGRLRFSYGAAGAGSAGATGAGSAAGLASAVFASSVSFLESLFWAGSCIAAGLVIPSPPTTG